ncbi:MAG: ABC-F family ATP-binding cassette domain-containing protein, partial [Planctomycetota bacterium]
DIDGRRWLEQFLAEEYRQAVIVVSHDRWFLDRVADRVIETERGALRSYPGNYSKYVELRRQQNETAARTYEKQLDRIRREEAFIRRYKAGQRAKQARGRETRLERFRAEELIDRPTETGIMNLALPKAPRSGEQVLVAEGIAKRYGTLTLFEDFNLTVQRGDRIGIIGPNGIGKTTLVKCLIGELAPDTGSVRLGSRLHAGHYRQLPEDLDLTLPVWQYLQAVMVAPEGARPTEQQARDLAGAFLFTDIEQDKPLGALSGGERSRAVLAGLVAGARNLLVLDEPSNHLDIPSSERLEAVLGRGGGWDGTLIMVTHDRALLDSTCNQLVVFDGSGSAEVFFGSYSDWEHRARKRAAAPVPETPAPAASPAAAAPKPRPKPARGGPSALVLAELERRIEALQERMGEIDGLLVDPGVYADGERVRALGQERRDCEQALAPLEAEWAQRAERG